MKILAILFLSVAAFAQPPACSLAINGPVQCYTAIRKTADSVGLGPPANYKVSQLWQAWPASKLFGIFPIPAGNLLLTSSQWTQDPATGAITINAGLKRHSLDTFVAQGVWQ
jgi:hypothetical protein